RETPSNLPKDVSTLSLEVMELNADCLHLTVKDPSSQRYEVQIPGVVPQSKADAAEVLYTIQYQHDPFGFIVQRKSNRRVIMDTTVAPLLFADQYLQLSTMLASTLVSGLGEHYTTLILDLNWTSLTFWNRDMAPHADVNLYGSHPFYIVQEEDGFAHGVFLLNSNAIEVMLQPTPALTWVSTGGILDLYVFLGPDPQSVIRQYLQIIELRRPSKNSVGEALLPPPEAPNGLPESLRGRPIVLLHGFSELLPDPSFCLCSTLGLLVPLGCLRSSTSQKGQDMNEPASFVQGSVDGCPDSDLENPPYTPRVVGRQLNSGTLCVSAQQKLSTHYNLHNLYGLTEAYATHRALMNIQQTRPFVLSRSSSPGIGQFSAVWTGDIRSDWEQLRYSIPAVLQFSLFGVPLVGADVCGFGGNTTEELCVRWMQLGAFYPFMRNHNDKPNAPQEPYVFGQKAQAAMRSALNLRYSLLPFLYTLFHHAHTSADTVARPLFMEFPTDPNCWTIDHQFLWGSSLLISPVLDEGVVELVAYLPPGTWYSLQNGQPFYSNGQYLLLPAPLDTKITNKRIKTLTKTKERINNN
ncbi:lysosomal alpha-glucosidase-like, partial [Gouania willdenowi]|uniref:lysosomal alpha-glucosidase-like n=1 Tax=Gouania willdenowi TaxID=441366 RepID=UPI0010562956